MAHPATCAGRALAQANADLIDDRELDNIQITKFVKLCLYERENDAGRFVASHDVPYMHIICSSNVGGGGLYELPI